MNTSIASTTNICTKSRGFTLIELLVVIAIIAVLAGLLLPALGRAKQKGQATQCLNNIKQMNVGLILFGMDNDDLVPGNKFSEDGMLNQPQSWIFSEDPNKEHWVDNRPRLHNVDPDVVLKGAIGRYAPSKNIFREPSDRAEIRMFRDKFFRNRTYQINMHLGGDWPDLLVEDYPGEYHGKYRDYSKFSEIPHPAATMTFVSGRPRGGWEAIGPFFHVWMDGFRSNPDHYYWNSGYPGNYHGGSENVGFADGHVTLYNYQDARTTVPWKVQPTTIFHSPGNKDVDAFQHFVTGEPHPAN